MSDSNQGATPVEWPVFPLAYKSVDDMLLAAPLDEHSPPIPMYRPTAEEIALVQSLGLTEHPNNPHFLDPAKLRAKLFPLVRGFVEGDELAGLSIQEILNHLAADQANAREQHAAIMTRPDAFGAASRAMNEVLGKKTKRSATKKRLEESQKETDKLKAQLYAHIQGEHDAGKKPAAILANLKASKDWKELIARASLRLNLNLVRAAIALPRQRERDKRRKQQESPPT
jgi:hypothetical protein